MWVSQTRCPNEMLPIVQRQNYLPSVAGILFRNYLMRSVKEQMDPNLNSSKQNLPFQLKLHTFSFLIIPNLLITTLTAMKPQTIITKHFCLFQVHMCYMSGIIICIPWLWCYTFIFYIRLWNNVYALEEHKLISEFWGYYFARKTMDSHNASLLYNDTLEFYGIILHRNLKKKLSIIWSYFIPPYFGGW